jgi:hypothetical protein
MRSMLSLRLFVQENTLEEPNSTPPAQRTDTSSQTTSHVEAKAKRFERWRPGPGG